MIQYPLRDLIDTLQNKSVYSVMTSLKRRMVVPYVLITSMLLLVTSLACSSLSNPEGWSGGVLVGESIVVASMEGQVLSLDIETGEHNWEPALIRVDDKNKNRRAIYGTPLVEDNVIFVTSYDGKIHAYSSDDGRLLETEPVAEEFAGGISYYEDMLFFGSSDGVMYGYDVDIMDQTVMMKKAWEFKVNGSIWSTPVIANGLLVFTSLDHFIYALDPLDGSFVWKMETGAALVSSPVVAGDNLCVGSFDTNFYAIDVNSGKEKWRFTDSSNWYWGSALLSGDNIYVPSLEGKLYALNQQNGAKQWETEVVGPIVGTPAIVSDMIVFGSRDGQIRVAELSSGMILASCDVGEKIESPLISTENAVYFSARDHSVRSLLIKQNGNPDEKWDSPYFSEKAKDEEDPTPNDWSPSC